MPFVRGFERVRHIGAIFAIFLPVVGIASSKPQCPICETSVSLSALEWECLARNIDRYLRVKTDPVLVPLIGCDQESALAEDRTRSDPSIVPQPSPGGSATFRRALRLSKGQLTCLKPKLAEFAADPPDIFDFETGCPSSASP